jgi:hypothetical protein
VARTSSNCKRETRSLVRESASHRQTRNDLYCHRTALLRAPAAFTLSSSTTSLQHPLSHIRPPLMSLSFLASDLLFAEALYVYTFLTPRLVKLSCTGNRKVMNISAGIATLPASKRFILHIAADPCHRERR